MNFQDRWMTDENNQKQIFTVEMQRRLSRAGLPIEPESLALLQNGHSVSVPERTERPERVEREPRREYQRPERVEPRNEDDGRYQRPEEQSQIDFSEPSDIQIDPQTGKYIGRVKWYNVKKGYGFIVRGGGEEIFFHKSGTIKDMETFEDGQWILYDVEDTHKGPEATDVEPYQAPV